LWNPAPKKLVLDDFLDFAVCSLILEFVPHLLWERACHGVDAVDLTTVPANPFWHVVFKVGAG